MPASGIEVSPELSLEWNNLRQGNSSNYIILGIENMEKFVVVTHGNAADPAHQAQQLIQDKEPAYILVRSSADKFFIIFYCPLGSKNALKMVYSSSLNALKSGLGTEYLVSEVYATTKAEVSQKELAASTVVHDRVALMSQQEQLQLDAAYSTVGALETETKMTADLPVQVSSAAQQALDALKSGASTAVVFTLNTNTEELTVVTHGNHTAEQLQSKLDSKTPAFLYFNHAHTTPEGQSATKGIFVYYCPSHAPVKSKMFHSSSKSPVMRIFEMNGSKKDAGFEADSVQEITTDRIMQVLYPPSQQIVRVAKPLPPHLRRKQGQSPNSPTPQ